MTNMVAESWVKANEFLQLDRRTETITDIGFVTHAIGHGHLQIQDTQDVLSASIPMYSRLSLLVKVVDDTYPTISTTLTGIRTLKVSAGSPLPVPDSWEDLPEDITHVLLQNPPSHHQEQDRPWTPRA